jgi:hypothetical protein
MLAAILIAEVAEYPPFEGLTVQPCLRMPQNSIAKKWSKTPYIYIYIY